MLELFGLGVTAEHFNELNRTQAINFVALIELLVDKGLVTHEEVTNSRVRATAIVDQLFEAKKADATAF